MKDKNEQLNQISGEEVGTFAMLIAAGETEKIMVESPKDASLPISLSRACMVTPSKRLRM